MGGVASSIRWIFSVNWANLPFLRSRTCDSTWARTEGHAHIFFSTFDVHSRMDAVRSHGVKILDLKLRYLILSKVIVRSSC